MCPIRQRTPIAALSLLVASSIAGAQTTPEVRLRPAPVPTFSDVRLLKAKGFIEALTTTFEQQVNPVLSARSLAELAALVCAIDKPLAGSLFEKAGQRLRTAETEVLSGNAKAIAEATAVSVRASHIACDPSSSELRKSNAADQSASLGANVGAALKLAAADAKQAMEIAAAPAASAAQLSRMELEHFLSLLIKLRSDNAAGADALFASALASLSSSVVGDTATRLSILGNYPFSSAYVADQPSRRQGGFVKVSVGGTLVYDITAERVDIPFSVTEAYLRTSAALLARPADSEPTGVRFALAVQLEEKARRLLPELLPSFAMIRSSAAATLSQADVQDTSNLGRTSSDFEKSVSAADPNDFTPERRDEAWLSIFASRVRREDLGGAKDAASKIGDRLVRDKLQEIVLYENAMQSLSKGELDLASAYLEQLTPGLRKAAASLDFAQQLLNRDVVRAGEVLRSVVPQIQNLPPRERASLSLVTVALFAKLDTEFTMTALQHAVNDLNEADKLANSNDRSPPRTGAGLKVVHQPWGFEEYVSVGTVTRSFAIRFRGLPSISLPGIVPLLGREDDLDLLQSTLMTLHSESRRNEALLGLARIHLRNLKR